MSDARRRSGRQGGRERGARGPAPGADLEYVLIGEDRCIAASIHETPMPLKWHGIDPVRLLKPGLYLRRSGALSLVSRDLSFDRAVMFALWEDPDASYRVESGRWVQPGIHAGFLIRSPSEDGPPWIPIMAEVEATPEAYAEGLLSPWLDQVSAVRFRPRLQVDGEVLKVASTGSLEEEAGTEALQELMRWLAQHPDDESAAAAAARRVLVDSGHGLQRLALTLMHADARTTGTMLEEVLVPLAPEVAPILQALWTLWMEPTQDEDARVERVRILAAAMHPALKPDAPQQRPAHLALLTTWINGLFGSRPDRTHVQPARSLFAVARFLRTIRRNLDLFDHPDVQAPVFPLDRSAAAALVRDLAAFPPDETDLERLLRALAIAEAFPGIARPNLDFLRPFSIAYPRLHPWPIAARSLLGRYDYVLSGWSFRGHEPRTGHADAHRLGSNLITEQPTITSARSLARTIGLHPAIAPALTEALAHSNHPTHQRIAALAQADTDTLREAHQAAADHARLTRTRLFDAILAAELLLARAQRAEADADALRDPVPPGPETAGARSHFMYWRMVCRSVVPSLKPRYIAFIDTMLDQLDMLPEKLQAELFALARRVLELERDPALEERWAAAFGTVAEALRQEDAPPHGERLDQLLSILGRLDRDNWLDTLTSLVRSERLGPELLTRVLANTRQGRTARTLAESPLMRELHSRLSGGDATARGPARAAWLRVALHRSPRAEATRWLLDPRHNTALFEDPAFIELFHTRGLHALEEPTDLVIDLLELALSRIPAEDIDVLLTQIRRHTEWPADEILKLLVAANRREAALEWMIVSGCGSVEEATFLFDSLATRLHNGADLWRAASLLPPLRRRFDDPLADGAASLEEAFRRYQPHRLLPNGLKLACDAFRLAEVDPSASAGTRLADQVGAWRKDRHDGEPERFLQTCIETIASRPLCDGLTSLLRGDDAPEDPGALLEPILEDAARWAHERGQRQRMAPSNAPSILGKGAGSRVLETAIGAAILNALRGADGAEAIAPGTLRARLGALREQLRPLEQPPALPQPPPDERGPRRPARSRRKGAEPERNETAAPLAASLGDALAAHLAARSAPGDATPEPSPSADKVLPDASSSDAGSPENTPRDADTTPAPEAVPPLLATFRMLLQHRVACAFAATVPVWTEVLERLADEPVHPRTLLERLATFHPAPALVRRDVLVPIAHRAQALGWRVRDPLDLLTSPQLEAAQAELDRVDLQIILDTCVALLERHGRHQELVIERNGLLLSLTPARRPDSPGQELGDDSDTRVAEREVADSDGDDRTTSEERPEEDGGQSEDEDVENDRLADGGSNGPEGGDPVTDEDDGANEADDDGPDADEEGDTAPHSDGPLSAAALARSLDRLLSGRSDEALSRSLFGDAITPTLLLRVVRRNPSIGLQVVRDRRHGRALLLRLSPPRSQRPRTGRPAGGRRKRGS